MKPPLAIFHPFGFAIAPILLFTSQNVGLIDLSAPSLILVPIVIALSGALLLFLLAYTVTRDLLRASLLASLGIVTFFTYGHLVEWFASLGLFSRYRYVHVVLVCLYGCGLGWAVWRLQRSRQNLDGVCKNLSIFTAILCVLACLRLGYYYHTGVVSADNDFSETGRTPEQVLYASLPSKQLPDVYFIVLDGYARADHLKTNYGFDNSDFIDALEERGLFVARKSRSNYSMTFLSLASTLNMRYLDAEIHGSSGIDRSRINAILHDHRVGRMFKRLGYTYLHFSSPWGPTQGSANADWVLPNSGMLPEFQSVLISTTLLNPLMALNLGAVPLSMTNGGPLNRFVFDGLEKCPIQTRSPRFTFAHILCPHPSFRLDRFGRDVARKFGSEVGGTKEWVENPTGYVEQVMFCNSRTLAILDAIKASSDVPPIVIIESDHGSIASLDVNRPAVDQPSLIDERTANLNAMLVPEEIRAQLKNNITPVNTFRVIFSELFDLKLEPLEDRVYFSWYDDPYQMKDVTEVVRAIDSTE